MTSTKRARGRPTTKERVARRKKDVRAELRAIIIAALNEGVTREEILDIADGKILQEDC